MTNRSDPDVPGPARLTLRSLLDRIAAADLDPVQIASMHLHLSHVMRAGNDGMPSEAALARPGQGVTYVVTASQ